jgi:hypothetical protein
MSFKNEIRTLMYDLISRFHRLDIAFYCDAHDWMKPDKMKSS